MKTYFILAAVAIMIGCVSLAHNFQQAYILEHENEIAKEEPGPHDGGGMSTGYSFFSEAKDLKMAFRKRVLHKGSAIGYHLQKEDEVYYIVSGEAEMKMNGRTFKVKAGDAILTRPGSSHGLQPTGNNELTLIIAYGLNQ